MTIAIMDPRGSVVNGPSPETQMIQGPPVGSLQGKRIGIRIDEMWESWTYVASEWEHALRELGAVPVVWKAPIVKGSAEAEVASASFQEFKSSIDGAIVGLCNCGSCTLWAIHDALSTLEAGLPTVVVTTEQFTRLARLLAGKGGRTEIRLVELPYPLQGRPEPEIRDIGRQHFQAMLDAFGAKISADLTQVG